MLNLVMSLLAKANHSAEKSNTLLILNKKTNININYYIFYKLDAFKHAILA